MAECATNRQVEMASALAQTYARSLFDLAHEASAVEAVNQELADLVTILQQQVTLRQLFAHQTIAILRRGESIEKIFKGRVSDLLFRFLMVLNRKQRLDQLTAIASAFRQMVQSASGEMDVAIYTAHPLTEAQQATVQKRLSAALSKQVVLQCSVDATLLGGLKLRIGDRLIDGSVLTRLRRMHRQLIASGRDRLSLANSQALDLLTE